MKKSILILFALVSSSIVKAQSGPRMDSFGCGLQIGNAQVRLSGKAGERELKSLVEDIKHYISQIEIADEKRNTQEQELYEQVVQNSWSSITYSLRQLDKQASFEAKDIDKICGIDILD